MKKLALVAAFAALVGSASAASITWGFGGQVYVSKDGQTAVQATSYSGTVDWKLSLVYLGQGVDTLDIGTLTSDSVVASVDYAISTATKTLGKWSPATTKTSTTAYENGASFAVVLYNGESGETAKFDYLYSLTDSLGVGAAVTSTLTVSDMSARGSGTVYGAGAGANTAAVVVPEPATAALALLGVGMLIKRRRA